MIPKDNTAAGARAFFPEGPMWPQVAYAPFNELGMGGYLPLVSYAPEDGGASGGADGGAEGGTDNAGGDEGDADPHRDIDNPANDMYPDQAPKADEGTSEGDDKDLEGDKADGDDGDEADGDKDDDGETEVDLKSVPEDGQYKLTMPEGLELDQSLLDEVSPIWKEKGFTHEEAQALTDKYIKNHTERAEKVADEWNDTVTKWGDQTKTDKEIGGDKFDASLKTAKSTLDRYGTPELRAALDNSGMGSHPELIRLLVKVGNATTDDDIPTPSEGTRNTTPNTSEAAAEELYGDTTPVKKR